MAYNYGLTGLLTMTSAGAFSYGKPIRVFDFCLGTTAAACSAILWNLSAAGDTAGTFPVITIKAGGSYFSAAGLRFPNGFWMNLLSAGTATVNYIQEF